MAADTIQDRFQAIGATGTADTLSSNGGVGIKGTPVAGPYPLGGNGEQQPAADVRLAEVPRIAGGVPA